MVQSRCDAIDINLGCPQNQARRGRYGAFLGDWSCIADIVSLLSQKFRIPISAKIRMQPTLEVTVLSSIHKLSWTLVSTLLHPQSSRL